ncbi:MAG TPA: hypothetical protein VH639_23485 [Bryobacteraceae bacterium]|jgi:uncharacterized protein (TIGR03437 family)
MRPFAASAILLCCAHLAQGAGTPSINGILNNYSYVLPGLPNYGIAPGSLFVVFGSNLNEQDYPPSMQSSLPPGLPTTLNGTSISVTVNGVTTSPGLYYAYLNQLAAVLPSNTPLGSGTIIVTNNGQTSAPAPIQVVQSAVGLAASAGAGSGPALAQDANYQLFSPVNSASPGQAIILWGSGVGADASNDDRTFPMNQNNLTSIPMSVFIGGVEAPIAYRGRSQFPGVDQVVVTIPKNVPVGCAVSIVAVSGTVASNSVTLPIAGGGGSCSDPVSPVTASRFQSLAGEDRIVSYGAVFVETSSFSGPGGTTNSIAGAYFREALPQSFGAQIEIAPSLGSCVIEAATVALGIPDGPFLPTRLGPWLTLFGSGLPSHGVSLEWDGSRNAFLNNLLPVLPAGGSFTFSSPVGGTTLPSDAVKLPSMPAVWTNQDSITTINRDQGLTVTWSGGAPDSYVQIVGTASRFDRSAGASFICTAPASAGQFTVPPWATLALPPADSTSAFLEVATVTYPQAYPIADIDITWGYGGVVLGMPVSYL